MIYVVGESEQDKRDLIDHVCGGGGDNNTGNNNSVGGEKRRSILPRWMYKRRHQDDMIERRGSILPMWMYKGRDQDDMIKQVQVALETVRDHDKIWTVESIYQLWTLSYKPPHDKIYQNRLRECKNRYHMMWLVYHVGRTSPKFEWRLVDPHAHKLYLLPVQLLVIEGVEEDPRGSKFDSEFIENKRHLFPRASEPEFNERILKVNVVADEEDTRIRLWVTCNIVQIRTEMRFAAKIMSRIGNELGPKGFKQIKSFVDHFTKEQVVVKSASFAFEVFCRLFEVPDDFREALEQKVTSWEPDVDITVFEGRTPPPNSFMHYCVWVVGVIVYSKSLRPGGWSSFECTPPGQQYPWTAEIDECLDSHLLDLHKRPWKELVDEKKTYEFLTKIFEDTRVKGAKYRNSILPIAPINPVSHDGSDTSVPDSNSSRRVPGATGGPPDIPPRSRYEAPTSSWFSFRGLCPIAISPLLRILSFRRPALNASKP